MNPILSYVGITFGVVALVLLFRGKSTPGWAAASAAQILATINFIMAGSWGWAIFSGACGACAGLVLSYTRRGAA